MLCTMARAAEGDEIIEFLSSNERVVEVVYIKAFSAPTLPAPSTVAEYDSAPNEPPPGGIQVFRIRQANHAHQPLTTAYR